jgi:hypothetical protein
VEPVPRVGTARARCDWHAVTPMSTSAYGRSRTSVGHRPRSRSHKMCDLVTGPRGSLHVLATMDAVCRLSEAVPHLWKILNSVPVSPTGANVAG